MLLACDICHGSGLTSAELTGRDLRCYGCGGAGLVEIAVERLGNGDLEQLALDIRGVLAERDARPVEAVGS
jgi:hypothetical protein